MERTVCKRNPSEGRLGAFPILCNVEKSEMIRMNQGVEWVRVRPMFVLAS